MCILRCFVVHSTGFFFIAAVFGILQITLGIQHLAFNWNYLTSFILFCFDGIAVLFICYLRFCDEREEIKTPNEKQMNIQMYR